MSRNPSMRLLAILLFAPLIGAGGCGSAESNAGADDTGTPDGGPLSDGSLEAGPVSVLPGSPVTLSPRAADGSVSGTYVDAHTLQHFTFSVRATGPTSAVASFVLDTLAIQVSLSGPTTATITMPDIEGSVTGYGPPPTDYGSQFVLNMIESEIFASALRAIPLELDCGQGFAPVEIAAMIFPWQVAYKYQLDPSSRYGDVQAAADAATCSAFEFAGVSPTQPVKPITKPSGSGLVNLGNDDFIPSVLGFFPLDDVGANDAMSKRVVPKSGGSTTFDLDTRFGPCDSMCRGACGADCESNNCKSTTGLSRCEVDTSGANTCYKLVYTDYVCGTHPACIAHDDCYDACNLEYGCGTTFANYCMHTPGHPGGLTSCDQHVIDTYGASMGFDWARGYGPYTDQRTFRYLASREYDDKACPCVHECVPAGTLVALADGGSVPIERFEGGEALETVDPSGDLASAVVQKVLVHRDGPYVLDRLESESGSELLVTPNHPVWTMELGWVPVSDLVVGAHLLEIDPTSGEARAELLVSIVRAWSATDVVYNLKTSRGSYVAAGILVHNKCLARGSLVDTPDGAVPIERLRPGDEVYGQIEGRRVATRVLGAYEKTTILGRLPGRRLAPHLLVTENHLVVTADGDREASTLPAAAEEAIGVVYDLATESGNYWAQGVLLRAGSSSTTP